eukprot:scaffold487_cov344-Prasinococcus_capsulatus_cf.AAC.8
MASCYGGTPGRGTRGLHALDYLNIAATLKNSRRVEVRARAANAANNRAGSSSGGSRGSRSSEWRLCA